MKRALVFGAERTIGKRLIERLKNKNYYVRAVDTTRDDDNPADDKYSGDLTKETTIMSTMFSDVEPFDEVYQLATSDSFDDTLLIDIFVLKYANRYSVGKIITTTEEGLTQDIYTRFNKDKDLNTLIIDISKKKKLNSALDTIIAAVKKDNKKALKNVGKLKK